MRLFRSESEELSQIRPFHGVKAVAGIESGDIFQAEGDDPRMVWRPGRHDRLTLSSQNGFVSRAFILTGVMDSLKKHAGRSVASVAAPIPQWAIPTRAPAKPFALIQVQDLAAFA